MRKLILISALVLASTTAQASPSRGLVMASNEEAATTPPTQEQTPAPAQETAPAFVARPAAVDVKPEPAKTEAVKIAPEKMASAPATEAANPNPAAAGSEVVKVEKPRRRHTSTEARVIYELHRHGIYW